MISWLTSLLSYDGKGFNQPGNTIAGIYLRKLVKYFFKPIYGSHSIKASQHSPGNIA
jgi:hypothetical protein